MSGKHIAEDPQCEARAGVQAGDWGYLVGSRCPDPKGHSTYRNGVGHRFPKAPKSHGYSAIDGAQPRGNPPKNPASSSRGAA